MKQNNVRKFRNSQLSVGKFRRLFAGARYTKEIMLKEGFIHLGIGFFCLIFLCSPVFCRTTFLVNFDDSYDAVFSLGEEKARFSEGLGENDLKLVNGKFGEGVFISRDVPALAISYPVKKNFSPKEGTLEFWFRPEWDLSVKEKEGRWKDKPIIVYLFSTSTDPTGFRLTKNQYSWLNFYYTIRYQRKGDVRTQYGYKSSEFQPRKWVHFAVSYNEEESRLFVNGMLVAVSDEWNIPGDVGSSLCLGSKPYGKGWGAWGTFDDFRISDHKRYVSSFPLPEGPLKVEKKVERQVPIKLSPEEGRRFNERKTLFYIDFSNGLLANFSAGSPYGFSNRKLEIEKNAIHLQQYPDSVGDTLFFLLKNNLNPSLGTVEISLQLSEKNTLPVVIFDTTRIVLNKRNPRDQHSRTGMRLILNKESCLEWQSIEDKKVISTVKSPTIELKDGRWYRFALSWAGSTVSLYQNGTGIAQEEGVALPSLLGRYFFIGSDSQGENCLDGWVGKVEITLRDKLIP